MSSVYFNFVINSTDPVNNTRLERTINRTDAILDKASDYSLRFLRAIIPTNSVPLFDYDQRSGLRPFSFNLVYNNVNYETDLVYQPTSDIPGTRAVFHPSEMIAFMNTALKASFDAIKLANPGITSTLPPELVIVKNTGMIRFLIPESFVVDNIDIYPSNNLVTFFSFEFYLSASGFGVQVDRQWKLIFGSDPLRKNIENINGTDYIRLNGDWETLVNFPQFELLRITTSIPIRGQLEGERTSKEIVFDLYSASDITGSNIVVYSPSGQIFQQDLLSDEALSSISIKIEWLDFSQRSYPIFLSSDQFAGLKLEFRPKNTSGLSDSDPYRSITSAPAPSSSRRLIATY